MFLSRSHLLKLFTLSFFTTPTPLNDYKNPLDLLILISFIWHTRMKSKEIIFGLFLISLSCALCDDDEWVKKILITEFQIIFLFPRRFITLIAPPVSHFSKPYETFLSTSPLLNDTNIVISFRSEMAAFKIRRHQGKQKLSNIIEFKKGGLHNSAGKKS